jgi:hypothetical protein
LEQIQADSHFLDKVITCDETWIFTYDPETKRQSMHWKTPIITKNEESTSKQVEIQSHVTRNCFL